MHDWIRRTSTVLAATAAIGLLGCGDETPTDPNGNGNGNGSTGITGSYSLTTVNGDPLPVVLFQSGADMVELTAGSISLNADNSSSFSLTIRETQSGSVTTQTETDVGSYTVNGNTVTFDFDGSTLSGVVSGGTLSFAINEEGSSFTLVFQK